MRKKTSNFWQWLDSVKSGLTDAKWRANEWKKTSQNAENKWKSPETGARVKVSTQGILLRKKEWQVEAYKQSVIPLNLSYVNEMD